MSKMLSLYHTVYTAQHKSLPQLYHPAAQDRLPTEAKRGWAWSVPGWPIGKTRLLLEKVLVRPARGAHPVVCVGPNAPV